MRKELISYGTIILRSNFEKLELLSVKHKYSYMMGNVFTFTYFNNIEKLLDSVWRLSFEEFNSLNTHEKIRGIHNNIWKYEITSENLKKIHDSYVIKLHHDKEVKKKSYEEESFKICSLFMAWVYSKKEIDNIIQRLSSMELYRLNFIENIKKMHEKIWGKKISDDNALKLLNYIKSSLYSKRQIFILDHDRDIELLKSRFNSFSDQGKIELIHRLSGYEKRLLFNENLTLQPYIERCDEFHNPTWTEPRGRRFEYETSFSAAIRETCEETGLKKDHIVRLYDDPITLLYRGTDDRAYKLVLYICVLREDASELSATDENEIDLVRWMAVDKIVETFPNEYCKLLYEKLKNKINK